MPIAEIATILGGLKTATDLIKSVLPKIKDGELKATIGELQSSLLEVQNGLLTVQNEYGQVAEENRQLKQELHEYEIWDKEKADYELKEVAKGVFVYVLKSELAKDRPAHWICANCFQDRTKSILQMTAQVIAGDLYVCPKCKTEICDHSQKRQLPPAQIKPL